MGPAGGLRLSTSQCETSIRYTLKFRRRVLDLVRAGRPIPDLVRQFGCTAATIHNWLRIERKQEKNLASGELTINERAELERLRRENRQLLMEREILSRAAAWSAQETHPSPERSSDS